MDFWSYRKRQNVYIKRRIIGPENTNELSYGMILFWISNGRRLKAPHLSAKDRSGTNFLDAERFVTNAISLD